MRDNHSKLTFAGQAGFILESKNRYRVGIDLYLSDCCDRYFGFKRLLPYLFDPLSLHLDLLIATHAHYDHFDPDSVPQMMSSSSMQLVCAYDVKVEAERLGLEQNRITYMREHDVFDNGDVRITAMPCDHGEDTPDAIGLLIELDGKRLYITGDTAFREDYFSSAELRHPDILIMPINGAFGNMNETEGAKAAGMIRPRLAIPCHYWNFARHGGNPQLFIEEMEGHYRDQDYLLMRPGEMIYI